MHKQIIVLVCGYGCKLTSGYEQYLERVIRFIRENLVVLVVCCGGYSQKKTCPTKSEAMVMRDYLKSKLHFRGINDLKILCESASLTTRKNLEEAKSFINGFSPEQYQLVIFCDASRALKVKVLTETIFPEYETTVETYDLLKRGKAGAQLKSTILEVLALRFPALARWHHRQRVKRAEQI